MNRANNNSLDRCYLKFQFHPTTLGNFFDLFCNVLLRRASNINILHFSRAVVTRDGFTESVSEIRTRTMDQDWMKENRIA